VLGVLPGLVGCFQALEAIKLLLGIGRSLAGRQIWLDTLAGEIFIHRLRRDPHCVVCGENPTVTTLIDYEQFCGLRPPEASTDLPAARAAG
jgi:adenylyltransferase/sulfurtransferase